MEQLLKTYTDNLDPELKLFIKKEDWRKKLRKICSNYGVKDEELITSIENETLLIIIGVEYIGDFLSNLEQTGISKIQAGPLSEAIAKDILFDVAEYLSAKEQGATQNLPDASRGLISDHEEIIKNPIKIQQTSVQNTPKTTSVQPQIKPQPIPINTANLSWEERKKKAEEALKNIAPIEAKKYPGGADPYRESI